MDDAGLLGAQGTRIAGEDLALLQRSPPSVFERD